MNNFFNTLYDFFSTNISPNEYKIPISLVVVLIFSILIFILSALIQRLRDENLLKIKNYGLKQCFQWSVGAVILDFILLAAQIINYNIVSFLIVAMVWDNIYQRILNQAKEREIANLNSIDVK